MLDTERQRRPSMTAGEWILYSCLAVIYLVLLFTAGTATFRKGHMVLLVIGIFFPVLWLVGWLLPPRRGSSGLAA
jgi:hypothetical protein